MIANCNAGNLDPQHWPIAALSTTGLGNRNTIAISNRSEIMAKVKIGLQPLISIMARDLLAQPPARF